jgi:AcrR family transcriptional regulator
MLIYYFGSREELITEALQAARRRQQQMLQEWAAQGTDQPAADRFRRFWGWLSSKEMEPYVRFFFDVQVYALRRSAAFHALLTGVVNDWVTFVQADLERQGVPRERAQATGTLLVAATRGLLLDLLSTGDRERVDRTFALLVWQLTTTTMTGRP